MKEDMLHCSAANKKLYLVALGSVEHLFPSQDQKEIRRNPSFTEMITTGEIPRRVVSHRPLCHNEVAMILYHI